MFNGHAVTYDLDGNMLNDGERNFSYDSANRLVTAGGHTYTYNAEDMRIRNYCESGEDTTYTHDTSVKLSRLLCMTTNGVVTKYVYGRGLIGEEVSGTFKTYHFDCRGSTIAITDASGSITDTFAYDTYGKLLSRTGTSDVIFGYNGRDGVVTDDNGLIYMRARYYSPDMKRFINADIIAGKISTTITLNRFAYANGDPVSFVDPFGLSAERGSVDLSTVLSADDLKKLKQLYDLTSLELDAFDISLQVLHSSLKNGLNKAVRPNNIPKGVWQKQIDADLKWLDDILGPASKLSKTLDTLSMPLIDATMVFVDAGIGYYENIQNNESSQEVYTDLAIDLGVGATTAGLSFIVTSAITGSAVGTACPVVGNVLGFLVGLAIGVGGYYLGQALDDAM